MKPIGLIKEKKFTDQEMETFLNNHTFKSGKISFNLRCKELICVENSNFILILDIISNGIFVMLSYTNKLKEKLTLYSSIIYNDDIPKQNVYNILLSLINKERNKKIEQLNNEYDEIREIAGLKKPSNKKQDDLIKEAENSFYENNNEKEKKSFFIKFLEKIFN